MGKPTSIARRQSPERKIHLAVLEYLRLRLPGAVVHHSPNEIGLKGKDVARQIAKAKHLGMLPGYPDLIVHWQGLTIGFEVKAPGNSLTAAQKAVRDAFRANGLRFYVVRSVSDVEAALDPVIAHGVVSIPFRGVVS